MPNWCIFDATVYGSDKRELECLVKRLNNAIDIGNETKQWHLYCLFEQHGWSKDEILSANTPYVGGSIEYVSPIGKNGNDYYIHVAMETRWSPMIEGFDKLLSNYLTLHAVYCAEEPGAEIYINTDVKHRFFSDMYVIYDDNGSEYFDSDVSFLNFMKQTYDKDIPLISDLKDDDSIDVGNGKSISFHRFVSY